VSGREARSPSPDHILAATIHSVFAVIMVSSETGQENQDKGGEANLGRARSVLRTPRSSRFENLAVERADSGVDRHGFRRGGLVMPP